MAIAFIFPGQGAQYVGMGKALADAYPEAGEVFAAASDALGHDLARLCWDGPADLLAQTQNTQPAILVASLAVLAVVRPRMPAPSITAGLSLGEYTALVCAGAMELADAVVVVRRRGQLMSEATSGVQTAMAALLGLGAQAVAAVCAQASSRGVVEPANFNSPGQIVIGGEAAAVEFAIDLAKAAGAKRAVKLAVSAPFHTSMMQPVADRFAPVLRQIIIKDAQIPVVSNVTAQPVVQAGEIRAQLIAQVASPVRWEQALYTMAKSADTFVEVGPGTALSGLVRRTLPDVQVLHVEAPESLEETLKAVHRMAAS